MLDKIVSAINELQDALTEARAETAEVRSQLDRTFRYGRVTDVSSDGTQYRQEIGVDEAGQPVKGPWVRHSQIAGGLKVHTPPAVGQGMLMISPNGDFEQAIGVPHSWSDSNAAPSSSSAENAVSFGPWKITLDNGALKVTGPKITVTGDVDIKGSVAVSGGGLTHEGKNVGSDHVHTGVEPGGANTGEPA